MSSSSSHLDFPDRIKKITPRNYFQFEENFNASLSLESSVADRENIVIVSLCYNSPWLLAFYFDPSVNHFRASFNQEKNTWELNTAEWMRKGGYWGYPVDIRIFIFSRTSRDLLKSFLLHDRCVDFNINCFHSSTPPETNPIFKQLSKYYPDKYILSGKETCLELAKNFAFPAMPTGAPSTIPSQDSFFDNSPGGGESKRELTTTTTRAIMASLPSASKSSVPELKKETSATSRKWVTSAALGVTLATVVGGAMFFARKLQEDPEFLEAINSALPSLGK